MRRRTVALDAFFTGYRQTVLAPGEFIARIDVPAPRAGEVFRCYKVAKRFDQDISAVCGAFRLTLLDGVVRDVRIGFGGMAATPARAVAVEQALIGRPWTEATVRMAQEAMDAAFSPLSDMRASAAYRRVVARNLLFKCFLETGAEAALTRLADRQEAVSLNGPEARPRRPRNCRMRSCRRSLAVRPAAPGRRFGAA